MIKTKGAWDRSRKLFYRILLGSWLLATLVLVNAYSSLLISYLTIPTLKPAAKSLDDIAFRNIQNLGILQAKIGISANFMFVMIWSTCTVIIFCNKCYEIIIFIRMMGLMPISRRVNYLKGRKYLLNVFDDIPKASTQLFSRSSTWCTLEKLPMLRFNFTSKISLSIYWII